MSDDIKEDLVNTKGDFAYTTAKSAISVIPVIGGVAAELFSAVIAPPISKRRDEWLIRVANGLAELQKTVSEFNIHALSENEMFITTIMHATNAAIKNHNQEKLEALKNAVLNAAVGIKIDDSLQQMFLNYIDSMTPWHLKILCFFSSPSGWYKVNNRIEPRLFSGSPAHVIEDAFDELKGKRNFYDLIVKDLYAEGLLEIEGLHTTMTGQGAISSRTTDLGNQFISYITNPS